jgi:hypothetical protein
MHVECNSDLNHFSFIWSRQNGKENTEILKRFDDFALQTELVGMINYGKNFDDDSTYLVKCRQMIYHFIQILSNHLNNHRCVLIEELKNKTYWSIFHSSNKMHMLQGYKGTRAQGYKGTKVQRYKGTKYQKCYLL